MTMALLATPPGTDRYRLQVGDVVVECIRHRRDSDLGPTEWVCEGVPWQPPPEVAKTDPKPRKRRPKRRRRTPRPNRPFVQKVATSIEPTVMRRRDVEDREPAPSLVVFVAMRVQRARGLDVSPLDELEVRQREDAEAVAEAPGRFQHREPTPIEILMNGTPRIRVTLDTPEPGCEAKLKLGGAAASPPSLKCVKDLIRRQKYDRDAVVPVMHVLTMLTGFPLWRNVIDVRVQKMKSERISPMIWALGWLQWVTDSPAGLDAALAELSPLERRTLRRAISRWWDRPGYEAINAAMTRILQTRFTVLVPTCGDERGFPIRRCFVSDHLYDSNLKAAKTALR